MNGEDFKRAINQLASEMDFRIINIPAQFRFVADALGHIVDLRAGTIVTFEESELNAALIRNLEAQQELKDVEIVRDASKSQAENIPAWASWTELEVIAWVETNLPDDNTRIAVISMARMIVALRNQTWPELQSK